jgi:hypothetical protein
MEPEKRENRIEKEKRALISVGEDEGEYDMIIWEGLLRGKKKKYYYIDVGRVNREIYDTKEEVIESFIRHIEEYYGSTIIEMEEEEEIKEKLLEIYNKERYEEMIEKLRRRSKIRIGEIGDEIYIMTKEMYNEMEKRIELKEYKKKSKKET